MQDPLLHWNSSTFLFGIQVQGIVYLSCAQINPHLTVSQIEFGCERGCQTHLGHGHSQDQKQHTPENAYYEVKVWISLV